MEADCHDSICGVKCLLYTIPVMHIYVDVEHTIMVLEKLKNCKHDVIYIAKTACLLLFCMVQASRPVYCDVCGAMVQLYSRID